MKFEHPAPKEIPVLPLRDVVVYPHMVIPLFVGRKISIKCLQFAVLQPEKNIFLVAQKEEKNSDPIIENLFSIGTIATIVQFLELPDGTIKILVEGKTRARIAQYIQKPEGYFVVQELELITSSPTAGKEQRLEEGLVPRVIKTFEKYSKLNKKVAPEILRHIEAVTDPHEVADKVAAHIPMKIKDKQAVLEIIEAKKRLEFLMTIMNTEIELLHVEKRIRNRIKKQMEKSQREYYLNEQIKAIQKELGDQENDELDSLKKRLDAMPNMPEEARKKLLSELQKLRMMPPMSAEATVVRSYVDWMLQIPWGEFTTLDKKIDDAEKILDADHYGLKKVKERILEYLAVEKRKEKLVEEASKEKIKAPILCLVGPPGVGKTSLGQSIARATGRKYVRLALGGLRDEAEIRGHRRTYIGAMPGKLMQKIAKVGVKNPLFLLDEVDKMASDMRGDPASALLEVLDPEQNITFNDHYLEVDYDLSDVMFVATSNSMNLPSPLLDRMEIIHISGYTETEKLNIAKQHLTPKQFERNGVQSDELIITDEALLQIIRHYTRESGVRSLEREISKLCRKIIKAISLDKTCELEKPVIIDTSNLKTFLGVPRFDYGKAALDHRIGEVTGLAWTQVGGDLLTIESMCVPGKGKLIYTGSLGEVMRESIQAALTLVRARVESLSIANDFHEKFDIHVHVPEGATPKDGPSAGIGVFTALVSCLTKKPVRSDLAMTGEITLSGAVLPIGGLKEKLLAAQRGGIKEVLIPADNERDLADIPENDRQELKITKVKTIEEVFAVAFADQKENN